MQDKTLEERFRKLVKSDDDSVSFFPYGGDSYDFSEENCIKFLRQEVRGASKKAVVEAFKAIELPRADCMYVSGKSDLENQVKIHGDMYQNVMHEAIELKKAEYLAKLE
jgi:hypothetical protein